MEMRAAITAAERQQAWREFRELPVSFRWRALFADRALEIAVEARLTKVYDAIYLACADTFDVDLLTCDASFARSVAHRSTRVRLVGPAV